MQHTPNIAPYLNASGKITKLPRKQKAKKMILAYVADKFELNCTYTEPEINTICDEWHTFGDYFLLRRELIEHGYLVRKSDGSQYWRVQRNQNEVPLRTEP